MAKHRIKKYSRRTTSAAHKSRVGLAVFLVIVFIMLSVIISVAVGLSLGRRADALDTVGDHQFRSKHAIQIQITCIIKRIGRSTIKVDFAPRGKVTNIYRCKTRATIERPIADALDTVADRHARKICAIFERPIADARYAVADRHARKICAIFERIIADARYTIRDHNARKSRATIERPIADACYTVGDHNAR